jgi:hypothetical protein
MLKKLLASEMSGEESETFLQWSIIINIIDRLSPNQFRGVRCTGDLGTFFLFLFWMNLAS